MKEYIIELITVYGLETVLFAFAINILTGLIKLPIKKLASNLKDSSMVTRFIVFLPILLGFGLTVLYYELFKSGLVFNKEFITLWITSTSLSLTFYAIYEKLFPSKKKIIMSTEIIITEKILSEITNFLNAFLSLPLNEIENKRIILKGKKEKAE